MKVIFLDIDGVMNNDCWLTEQKQKNPEFRFQDFLNPVAVDALNSIVEKSGASVVISSSWRRFFTPVELRELFAKNGFKGTVLDSTPLSKEVRAPKAAAIKEWLAMHPNVQRCVVVDDREEEVEGLIWCLIPIDWKEGLTKKNEEDILYFLNDL